MTTGDELNTLLNRIYRNVENCEMGEGMASLRELQKEGMLFAAAIAEKAITRDDIEEFTGAQFAAEKIREAASSL